MVWEQGERSPAIIAVAWGLKGDLFAVLLVPVDLTMLCLASWSQYMTRLWSILLISVTDPCVPLILRPLVNVAGLFWTQVMNTSALPTRAHEDFWFYAPHLTGMWEPLWGWSFRSYPGNFLSCRDCISYLLLLPFWIPCCSKCRTSQEGL